MDMNKSMMFMMLACLGVVVLPYLIPAGWLSGGIGFALLAVILLACCLPMIKMMLKGKNQEGETVNANVQEAEIVQDKIQKAEIVQSQEGEVVQSTIRKDDA